VVLTLLHFLLFRDALSFEMWGILWGPVQPVVERRSICYDFTISNFTYFIQA